MLPERWVRAAGIAGTLALLGALILFFHDGEISTRVLGLLAGCVVGLSVWIVFAPEDLRGFFSGRQAVSGTTSIIMTILFVALIVVVYVEIDRQDLTIDFTDEQQFTLNQPSLAAIERIRQNGRPVRLVGFYPRTQLREQEAADIILRQYDEQGGDMIDVRFVDPDEEPLLARTYAYNSLDDKQNAIYASFVLSSGEPDPASIRYVGAVNERVISSALLEMTAVSETKFYFTIGHTELDINSQAGTGLSRANSVLELLNIESDEINLLTQDIPDDATALVIAGPSSAFDQTEVDKIADYVAQNGRLLIMVNPPYVDATFGGSTTPLLEDSALGQYLWDEFGIRARDDLVVDFGSSFDTEFIPVPALYNGAQEIMQTFTESTVVVFPLARSIELVSDPQAVQQNYIREWLMMSSEDSYGETTLREFEAGNLSDFNADEDIPGPLMIGAAVRSVGELERQSGSRVVLIGDIDWLTNDLLIRFEGNGFLWSQIAEWVGGTPERALIDAVIRQDLLPITATEQERQRISLLTTVVMPLLVLLLGVLVWYARRRA